MEEVETVERPARSRRRQRSDEEGAGVATISFRLLVRPRLRSASETSLICGDCRQSEVVLYDTGCHSFSFLLLR